MLTGVLFNLQFNITLHDSQKTTKLKFDFKHTQVSKYCRRGTVSPKHTNYNSRNVHACIRVSLHAGSRMKIFSFLSPSSGWEGKYCITEDVFQINQILAPCPCCLDWNICVVTTANLILSCLTPQGHWSAAVMVGGLLLTLLLHMVKLNFSDLETHIHCIICIVSNGLHEDNVCTDHNINTTDHKQQMSTIHVPHYGVHSSTIN